MKGNTLVTPAASVSVPKPTGQDLLVLLLLAVLLFAAGLGLRDPWPADEPRFALIARDMVLSGEWLIPRVGGELYSDKPPLFMWTTAALYWLTGNLRVAFLLPSLLAGLGMLALVHDMARRLWGREVALRGGLLLLLTVQFTLQVRTAQLDAAVAFFTTLGLYGLLRHLLVGPHWGWYVLGWFAMGLGVITKGVGFLPVLAFLPWAVVRLAWPRHLPARLGSNWAWWLGPAAMLAATALWLVPMLMHVSQNGSPELLAYRDDILLRQTAERYVDSWGHLKPAWYYLVEVIPWAWLPVSLALPWLIPLWWRRMRVGDPATWILLGWVICVIAFFSLSPGKRGVYLLPAVPALVLAAAPHISEVLRRPGFRRLALMTVASVAGLAVAGLALPLILPAATDQLLETHDVSPWSLLAVITVIAAGLTVYGWRNRGPAALGLLLFALWQLHGWCAYPILNPIRSGADLMAETAERVPENAELGLVAWKEQFLLHLEHPVHHFGYRRETSLERRDALAWLAASPNRMLLIPERLLEPCLDPALAVSLGFRHRRQWMLVGPDAVAQNCSVAQEPVHIRRYEPATGGRFQSPVTSSAARRSSAGGRQAMRWTAGG